MQQRRSRIIMGVLSLGLLAGAVLTAGPAQAASGPGPYYAEPAWAQRLACPTIDNCPRFLVLTNWGSAAVLDKETGLVWERSPAIGSQTWIAAVSGCTERTVGGRKGWRLPSIPELASLMDPFVVPGPRLPLGHPFTNVTLDFTFYWSATTNAAGATQAWILDFSGGGETPYDKTFGSSVWCVRGGNNAARY